MKNLLFLSLACVLFTACTVRNMAMRIPANQSLELDYPAYELYEVSLKNQSIRGLNIAVLNKKTGDQVRGFGLGTKSGTKVLVEKSSKLVIENSSNSPVGIRLGIQEKDPASMRPKEGKTYIRFTLENTTAKSIPLIIPTVMNPNLSPFSKSGVDLKIGQEIIFKANGKRYVLLTVDESIKDGEMVNVAKVLKARKQELGLK